MSGKNNNGSGYRQSPPPSLPSDSGEWAWTERSKFLKDTAFVDATSKFYRARADQSRAFSELLAARIQLAKVMTEVNDIRDICEHHYALGRTERAHELAMLELRARIEQQALRNDLQQLLPPPATPPLPAPSPSPSPVSSTSAGIQPADVMALLDSMPDVSPETKETLSELLPALAKEKKAASS